MKHREDHGTFLYATIKRGTQKVTSPQQHALLHVRHLPHTDVYRKDGKIIRRRVFPKPGYFGHPWYQEGRTWKRHEK